MSYAFGKRLLLKKKKKGAQASFGKSYSFGKSRSFGHLGHDFISLPLEKGCREFRTAFGKRLQIAELDAFSFGKCSACANLRVFFCVCMFPFMSMCMHV